MGELEIVDSQARRFVDLPSPARLSIGRSHDNDIVVSDESVSRTHLLIETQPGRVVVEDQDSTNGTQVNNETLPPFAPRVLGHNDVVRVGDSATIRIILPDTIAETATARKSQTPPVSLTPAEAEVLELLFLHYDAGAPVPSIATVKEIAAERVCSEAAVKQHLLHLYDKFGLVGDDRTKECLANEAIARGITRRR